MKTLCIHRSYPTINCGLGAWDPRVGQHTGWRRIHIHSGTTRVRMLGWNEVCEYALQTCPFRATCSARPHEHEVLCKMSEARVREE